MTSLASAHANRPAVLAHFGDGQTVRRANQSRPDRTLLNPRKPEFELRTDDSHPVVASVVSRNVFRDSPGWPGPHEARSLTRATTT